MLGWFACPNLYRAARACVAHVLYGSAPFTCLFMDVVYHILWQWVYAACIRARVTSFGGCGLFGGASCNSPGCHRELRLPAGWDARDAWRCVVCQPMQVT